ncbi:MAG: hypothetical protein JXA95_13655 [Spirochaetales bacterium]|nr:hypothetical protein [Spirochaetales bacterium]
MRNILIGGLTALMILAPLGADDFDFGDFMAGDEGGAAASVPSLDMGGTLSVPFRASWGDWTEGDNWKRENLEEGSCTVDPDLKLDLSFSSDKADFKAVINANEADMEDNLFDELSLTVYGDNMTAALGWQKVVWGKGDKVHVLDVLNPMDYTDFLNPDYLDRKIAQPMIDVAIPHRLNGKLELVYVPFFTADKLSSEGAWVMGETQDLINRVQGYVQAEAISRFAGTYDAAVGNYGDTLANAMAAAAQTAFLSENSSLVAFLPDTASLKYGQAGVRLTATLGQADLGAVYYAGRYRTPSVSGTSYDSLDIDYDPVQVFGLEAGMVLAGFNLRGEGAYYMTQDIAGDDKDVHNNSLNYVAGFDRDVPLHNVNVNLQVTGAYILNHDRIESGDIEADSDLTETTLVCNLSDSYNHEKVEPEVTLSYRVEDRSGMVKPSVDWNVDGNLTLTGSGTFLWGDDESFFGQFAGNDYVSLEAAYSF